jgi:hypothetical protein
MWKLPESSTTLIDGFGDTSGRFGIVTLDPGTDTFEIIDSWRGPPH